MKNNNDNILSSVIQSQSITAKNVERLNKDNKDIFSTMEQIKNNVDFLADSVTQIKGLNENDKLEKLSDIMLSELQKQQENLNDFHLEQQENLNDLRLEQQKQQESLNDLRLELQKQQESLNNMHQINQNLSNDNKYLHEQSKGLLDENLKLKDLLKQHEKGIINSENGIKDLKNPLVFKNESSNIKEFDEEFKQYVPNRADNIQSNKTPAKKILSKSIIKGDQDHNKLQMAGLEIIGSKARINNESIGHANKSHVDKYLARNKKDSIQMKR